MEKAKKAAPEKTKKPNPWRAFLKHYRSQNSGSQQFPKTTEGKKDLQAAAEAIWKAMTPDQQGRYSMQLEVTSNKAMTSKKVPKVEPKTSKRQVVQSSSKYSLRQLSKTQE